MTACKEENVVITSMPLVDSMHAPMAAPAVLKASLTNAGIKSVAIDLNIEVLTKVKSHPESALISKFFRKQEVPDFLVQEISKILSYCAKRIVDCKPTVIALSLLTYECQKFTMWLCMVLRQTYPQARIVIGGPGIKNTVSNFNDEFRTTMLDLGLIDHYITGDGDRSLVEYVKGNYSYPGINSDNWTISTDLDLLPYPDWSDYNFYLYSQEYMPVVDAKGCVRNCEFCDVIEFWEKFQSRKAENLFKELLFLIDRYGMRDFDFRSSLSNGNLKEFKKLLDLMYEYNQERPYGPEQIRWNASFIVRQKSQHPEEMWEKMGATHATLSLGIESVVPHVRKNIGKYFENEDIDYHLEMAKKHNVKIIMMIITGYPTETIEDYEYTKQWFQDRIEYRDTISKLFLNTAGILPNTGLERNMKNHGIMWLSKTDIIDWQTESISKEQRLSHHQELVEFCKKLGFNVNAG